MKTLYIKEHLACPNYVSDHYTGFSRLFGQLLAKLQQLQFGGRSLRYFFSLFVNTRI